MARPDRLLLASIHDVSPRFESEVDRLIDMLQPHVGDKIAMLVVPNHWGDAPIVAGSAFATRLRHWAETGIEMFLHGFTHCDETAHRGTRDRTRARLMTAGEGEFLGLSRSEAAERIRTGRTIVEQATGLPVTGFVAPAWLYGPGALEALADCAMPLAEDHMKVWSPASGARLASGPVITWASRTPIRLASSLLAAKALRRAPMRVMRIGVHPPDGNYPSLVRSIDRTFGIALKTRRAGRYSDLRV
jgi:predicted deacetylase